MIVYHQPANSLNQSYNINIFDEQEFDLHFHKNPEVIYVIQGSVSCKVNGEQYILREGDFGLCLSYEIHAYKPAAHSKYWICVFSEDYVHTFAKAISGKTGNTFKFNVRDSVKRYVQEEFISESATPSLYTVKSCLYAICDEYSRNVRLISKDKSKAHVTLDIIDYVSENYKKNISLYNIAELLGYDYHYTSRFFHSVFNMSFNDFLNIYRLEHAITLLNETNKKIVNIAYESGFQSVRTFNACFKKRFRTTPSEFRRKI